MIFRLVLLILALGLAALSSLTVCRAWSLPAFRAAVLCGEYGHVLWLAAAAVLVGAGTQGTQSPLQLALKVMTVVAALAAIALLLKPVFQAREQAAHLAARLRQTFGEAAPRAAAFSFRRLFQPIAASSRPVEIVYAQEGGEQPPRLDFYRAARNPAPCVVVIHGGGWDSGNRQEFTTLNHRLAAQGFAVAAIDYRLAPAHRWPAQREDIGRAIAHLQGRHAELGLDPQRFVLLGRSAGGQLALATAYGETPPALRGVIALYAPADLLYAWEEATRKSPLDTKGLLRAFLGGEPGEARRAYAESSAYHLVRRDAPPTLLLHGSLDTLVQPAQSRRFAARLKDKDARHLLVEFPWATHAFDYNPRGPAGQLSEYAILWFLEAVLEGGGKSKASS